MSIDILIFFLYYDKNVNLSFSCRCQTHSYMNISMEISTCEQIFNAYCYIQQKLIKLKENAETRNLCIKNMNSPPTIFYYC